MTKEFWIFKGECDFNNEMDYDFDANKQIKNTIGDDFYDLVLTSDTTEGTTHVIAYSKYENEVIKNDVHREYITEVQDKHDVILRKLNEAVETIEKIAAYETCWKCQYYIGATSKYCNPPVNCDVRIRDQFIPVEKSKIIAQEFLDKHREKNG